MPPAGYALFWVTGILDHRLGGLLGSRSATDDGPLYPATVERFQRLQAAAPAVIQHGCAHP